MTTFKRNLIIGYSVSLILLIASAIVSFFSINNLLNSSELVNHTNDVIKKMEGVFLAVKEGEAGQRGYLLTDSNIYLKPYEDSREKAIALIQGAKELTVDNQEQQNDLALLKLQVDERFAIMQRVIDKKKTEGISQVDLELGRQAMVKLQASINKIEKREEVLLKQRTEAQNRFAASTPVFIMIASILAVIITLLSFFRTSTEFNRRSALQKELEQKDKEVTMRINIIQGIAEKISKGDYSIRVDEKNNDVMGTIAGSLNRMAESLQTSFEDLAQKQWLQTGVVELNNEIVVEKEVRVLAKNIINMAAAYSNSQAGAFYVVNSEGDLELEGSYGLDPAKSPGKLQHGQGIAGQAAASQKTIEVNDISPGSYTLSFVSGELKPTHVIAVPIMFNKSLKGVIELASLKEYSPRVKEYFKSVAYYSGIAVNTAQNNTRVQNLLEETQAQSEELQSQHGELENVNAELEAQAEKLQASEEELRVQQEEMLQVNQELEERSRMLEEKNEMILERNLEIQKKAEELSLSTRYKSEFLANMSHELRTPLNSILLLSRLLSENHENNLSGDQVEYANVIQSSGKGLLTLIDEILDLSKIESGKMELEYTEVQVKSLTDALKGLFAPIANDKGINFSIETTDDVPGMIFTDRLRLEQVLRNLLSNALKFTKKGFVKLGISTESNNIYFTVTDTGIGIPADKQQTIFEAFQQADGSTRRQFGGTGLGLSISRELARLLGGEIRLTSFPGKGSEFVLVLPLEKGQKISIEEIETAQTEEPEIPGANPFESLADKKFLAEQIPASLPDDRDQINEGDKVILIIEDDTGFAKSLLDYTRSKGYKGVVAVRGDEGIELAKRLQPLGILLDVQLPVKTGWEVIEELKNNPVTKPIPVHMMSSHEVKTRSISKGAVDFINKPVAFEKLGEIFERIEHALSRYPKKVLIVEENTKHAKALAHFLESYQVNAEIKDSVDEGIKALNKDGADCVILDMGVPDHKSYDVLEEVKKTPGLENLPIIVFTGRNLSHVEEMKIKQYADSIVVKTAHSYQRILDEVSLFLHLVEENKKSNGNSRHKRLGQLSEILKGKNILIADDDVRNIFSLTRLLEGYGINVISAIDGKDALKQLKAAAKVDLVLMDMMMPEMDGYEATRKIRENNKYKKLPVIAVTAKAMTGDREKCIAAGASDYITKPVDADQLISLLRVWLYE